MEAFIYFFLLLYIISDTFVFRFQRTTLSVSRVLLNQGNANLQMLLTPNWVGLLGRINRGLWIALTMSIFVEFGWLWSVVLLGYIFFGSAITDIITPVPSYAQCFTIIKKTLHDGIKEQGAKNHEAMAALQQLLDNVESIEREHKIRG